MGRLNYILYRLTARVENNIQDYVLTDFTDTEEQEKVLIDFLGEDVDDSWIEGALQEEDTQKCFNYLQELADEYRRRVLRSYAEMQEIPKQFRRDVL